MIFSFAVFLKENQHVHQRERMVLETLKDMQELAPAQILMEMGLSTMRTTAHMFLIRLDLSME